MQSAKTIKLMLALDKALVNISSQSDQGSHQRDFPNFTPLMSALTTYKHKEMVL
jgi:hypothetical protein